VTKLTDQALVELALKTGVQEAKVIDPATVVAAEWVRLKCQFGCDGYGKCLTCPPRSPTPAETRVVLSHYSRAMLVHNHGTKYTAIREAVADLERTVFLAGYHKAFAMGSGPCHLCDTCDFEEGCRHAERARPAMEACGIDVFTTARNNGFAITTVRDRKQTPDYFGLLLVE
jgi:predicted metal-binding protein